MSCHILSYLSCLVMSCHVCHVMSCHVMSCPISRVSCIVIASQFFLRLCQRRLASSVPFSLPHSRSIITCLSDPLARGALLTYASLRPAVRRRLLISFNFSYYCCYSLIRFRSLHHSFYVIVDLREFALFPVLNHVSCPVARRQYVHDSDLRGRMGKVARLWLSFTMSHRTRVRFPGRSRSTKLSIPPGSVNW
jgi:hypothetical protein